MAWQGHVAADSQSPQKRAIKLSSAAQELIAMMSGPANSSSVIRPINRVPGEYLLYFA
jgi:hypothetical protein